MERVVTINLNGNPYQLDESAYDALRGYLSRAEAALVANPDKAEIIGDLEQAVADKCAVYLSPHKSVVAAAEMARILGEMGPVEGAEQNPGDEQAQSGEPPRKRLYRLAGDSKIAGVCSGVGAYFDIDANIIRLLFIIGVLFTGGGLLLVYIAMMFLIPSAQTSAEWAAAHGAPFNAQEVIDRAKREYARVAEDASRGWRGERRAWRKSMREQAQAWRHSWGGWDGAPAAAAQPVGYVTRIFAGLFAFVFSIVAAALLIAFLIALFSLLNTGAILGWTPPGDLPNWLAILILCIAYAALSSPLRHLRRGSYAAASGHRYRGGADSVVTLLAMLAGSALAYQFLPEFREWVRDLPDLWRHIELGML
jgi:phage shock protein PspC (stress-responsive transcriptional regulator)